MRQWNGLCLLLAVFALACAPSEPMDDLDGDDVLDRATGDWTLSADSPKLTAQVPIEYLGCEMGVVLTLRLETGSADVEIHDLDYIAGTFDYRGRTQTLAGMISGQPLGGTLSDTYTIWGYDPLGTTEASAALMLIDPGPTRRFGGSGCSDVSYAPFQLGGSRYLEFELELLDGESASVSYDIEYFDCGLGSTDADPRKIEVCEAAWDAVYSMAVGETYETSNCPAHLLRATRCSDWGGIWGSTTHEITEGDVNAALLAKCRDTEVMDIECC